MINAYALVFGMAIVTGGRLADMFGRRRVFFIGAAIFAVFSALGGAAPERRLADRGRVVMGIGGALMWPAILGMTFAALPASRAALAGALILGIAGIGNAAGPLIGGAAHRRAELALDLLPQRPDRALRDRRHRRRACTRPRSASPAQRIDYAGIASLSLGLLFLLLALDQSADWGLDRPAHPRAASASRWR